VIRDILHRLADRFPRHVLVWPVQVQGEAAAQQVADAIAGFNAIRPGGPVPRPDLLIVARGGGSLEDLMPFNEEVVVRAVALGTIPLISAVGHETDTTLIDFAADRRAPTPTAAAEMAVPVRAQLAADIADRAARLSGGMARLLGERGVRVDGLRRGLGDPRRLVEGPGQRLDDRSERLDQSARALVERRRARVAELAAALPPPRVQVAAAARHLDQAAGRLGAAARAATLPALHRLESLGERLSPKPLERIAADAGARLDGLSRLLVGLSYEGVLERGYALIRDADGKPLTRVEEVRAARGVLIEMKARQTVPATIDRQGRLL
jgi:exodeoxyribonuclease VII large subunit